MVNQTKSPVLISIGILAHNEESVIRVMLTDLFRQSIFAAECEWSDQIEVICLPNGCSDTTADIARDVFLEADQQGIQALKSVVDIPEAGKTNAWNVFVHELSAASAQYIVLIDADIEFASTDAIEKMVISIVADKNAVVAVSQPIKDVAKNKYPSLYEKFLLGVAVDIGDVGPALAGSLYIARATPLKKIYMPKGLTVEDGFLRAMLLTEGFTAPEDITKIIRAPGVAHYYETLRSFPSILQHEIRVLGGTIMNTVLFDYFSSQLPVEGGDAGQMVRRLSEKSPNWVSEYITQEWKKRGVGIISSGYFWRRFGQPRGNTNWLIHSVKMIVRTGFDWVLALFVLDRLRKGTLVGRWA